jgi:dTMP kinase
MRGKFITLEGSEGAGKSTALEYIQQQLRETGVPLVVTREPGGTPLGEQLRAILLDAKHQRISDDTELLLMFAARAQHLAQVIKPALQEGRWVLCDRFTDATYAYQGGGRGIDMRRIAQLEQWVQGELRPDLTILLDVPVEIGMQRIKKRGALDRFEQEQMEFFERVRKAYLQRAETYPDQFRIIDAAQPLDGVRDQIRRVLNNYIKNN